MSNNRELGGVVLFKTDLNRIRAAFPMSYGLIFKVMDKTLATNVDIKIQLAQWNVGTKTLETIDPGEDIQKRGRPLLNGNSSTNIDDYKFEFRGDLIDKGFEFSFISNDQLDLLLGEGVDEIFITGCRVNYGTIKGKPAGEYFTFKIEPIMSESGSHTSGGSTNSIGIPGLYLNPSCPPVWYPE